MTTKAKKPEVVVFAEIVAETALAFRLSDGVRTEWVPKSQVKEVNDGVWKMPTWMADKRGFSHD